MIYLSVSYDQKDDAKAMGAKWDPEKKLWYAPDSSFTKLIENYPPLVPKAPRVKKLETAIKYNNDSNLFLIGENKNYGGNQLYVDLLPKNSSITLKRTLEDSEYSKLRNIIVKRVAYKCEICNIECLSRNNKYLQLCERYSYSIETQVQKLERIVAICKECYQTVRLLDKGIALSRLIEINQIDKEDAKQHILDAYDIWKIRSNIDWNVDLSMISNFRSTEEVKVKEEKKPKIKINKLDNSHTTLIKDIDNDSTTVSKPKLHASETKTHKIKIHKLDTKIKEIDCLITDE